MKGEDVKFKEKTNQHYDRRKHINWLYKSSYLILFYIFLEISAHGVIYTHGKVIFLCKIPRNDFHKSHTNRKIFQ